MILLLKKIRRGFAPEVVVSRPYAATISLPARCGHGQRKPADVSEAPGPLAVRGSARFGSREHSAVSRARPPFDEVRLRLAGKTGRQAWTCPPLPALSRFTTLR